MFLSGCLISLAFFQDVASERPENADGHVALKVSKVGAMASIKKHNTSAHTGDLVVVDAAGGAHQARAVPVPEDMKDTFKNIAGPERDSILAYFAGDDKKLDKGEIDAMKEVIGYFDGADNKLSADEANTMLDIIGKFDFDGDKDLDATELGMLVQFCKYFAGNDKELQEAEIANMKEVIGYFDGEDNKLSKDEAEKMMDMIKRHDLDCGGDLDDAEQKALVDASKKAAGEDKELNDDEIKKMQADIPMPSCAKSDQKNAAQSMAMMSGVVVLVKVVVLVLAI